MEEQIALVNTAVNEHLIKTDKPVRCDETGLRGEGQTTHFQSGRTWDFGVFVQVIGITPIFPDVPGVMVGKGIRIETIAAEPICPTSTPPATAPRHTFNASIIYTALYTYVGEPHGEEGEMHVWQGDGGYRKVRVVDGRLTGALLLDERHGSMALFKAIGQPVAQFGADITRPDFPFNDLTGQDWDYLFY